MSEASVGRIVKETCTAIWDRLLDAGYLKCPETTIEWKTKATEFEYLWNFPNCVGAVDGKHITIQCPTKGGSMYYNYKKFHRIVLMAVVDASYKFIIVDIGDYGRLSNSGVFGSCNLGFAITTILHLPEPRLVGRQMLKYVFVGDDAFPLRVNLIKP